MSLDLCSQDMRGSIILFRGWCSEARHEICPIIYIYITSCTVKIFSGVSYIRREKVYCQWNIWIKEWINSNITIKRTVTIFFLSAIRHIKDTSSSTITDQIYRTFLDLIFLALTCFQTNKYYINSFKISQGDLYSLKLTTIALNIIK